MRFLAVLVTFSLSLIRKALTHVYKIEVLVSFVARKPPLLTRRLPGFNDKLYRLLKLQYWIGWAIIRRHARTTLAGGLLFLLLDL